ncbi:uracil-DNA glycosylase family protein [Psychrosphaera sp. 1_MG-2023]|uniref:uracil-DNA glycosylase family protein n=1 Tax=Psychrosphaera sp. 1_MG-2023 TaxID=3062643 RepID=UPI0026E2B48A|nr:uracil-DNA glycosylase family protein [Psychrosphaera sp. 1_MG-2023]MDO6720345.1 uracil-DNA glycosylase family protein [Psychrosphaera sp. 1_MG-2023]
MTDNNAVISALSNCTLCKETLPLPPRPIFQLHSKAKILIIGQAPGLKTHQKNRAFDDASGDRLREWLGMTREQFYNEQILAIMPMAFCYPGKVTNSSGDKAPPKICSQTWHQQILGNLGNIELTLIIGRYAAQKYVDNFENLTSSIRNNDFTNKTIVLPHPSPRNNIWISKNRWFETKTLPKLRQRILDAFDD